MKLYLRVFELDCKEWNYRMNVLAVVLLAAVFAPCLAQMQNSQKEYKTPAGDRAAILFKKIPDATRESLLKFYGRDGRLLCTLDYSSSDGEHGFGVENAAWTPDNNYFVFALASSGGHQAWHSPVLVFSREQSTIVSLDQFTVGLGLTGGFSLRAPHNVLTKKLKNREIPITFDLARVFKKASSTGAKKTRSCASGKAFKMDNAR